MLDEPTAGLTKSERARIGRVLVDLVAQYRLAVVLVEHDLDFVREYRLASSCCIKAGSFLMERWPRSSAHRSCATFTWGRSNGSCAARVSAAPALDVAKLASGYGDLLVIHDVSLTVRRGEIVALLGKNGMGKTTLARTILGFLSPRQGSIVVAGRDVTGSTPDIMVRNGIAHAPQEKAIFQDLSVRDNLRLASADDRTFRDNINRVFNIFPFFEQRLAQKAGTLSGGEQKMLIVARAIMVRPRLLIIDEISEGLQPSVVERIAGILRDERDANATSILLIEQNIAFALSIADRWAVLKRGEIDDVGIVEAGAAETIGDHLAV